MQPDTHSRKYAAFLDGLAIYVERAAKPMEPRKGRELDALLAWRDQPSGDPLQSNWKTSAANDNKPMSDETDEEERGYTTEMVREIVPTVGQILKAAKKAEFRDAPAFAMIPRNRAAPARRTEPYPVGGDVEYGKHISKDGREHKVVVRIGKLRFSDGTQTEKAMVREGDGKIVEKRVRVRTMAMLGTRERLRKEKGSSAVWGADNKTWVQMLDGNPQPANDVKSGPVRRGKSYSPTESRAMLAEAIEKTVNMPPVTKCPAGLPYKPDRVADMFLAGKKGRCAGGGAATWQEDATALVSRDEWLKARAEMLKEDVAVLDAAMTAKNYGDIGAVVGKSRKSGPRLLRAANDNAAAAIRKFTA